MLQTNIKRVTDSRIPEEIEQGMIFQSRISNVYMVVISDNGKYLLASLFNGNRWTDAMSLSSLRCELVDGGFYHVKNAKILVEGEVNV